LLICFFQQSAPNDSTSKLYDKDKAEAAPTPASTPIHDVMQQRLEARLARETEQEMVDVAHTIINNLRGASSTPVSSSKVYLLSYTSSEYVAYNEV
jgi:hypothetical protein